MNNKKKKSGDVKNNKPLEYIQIWEKLFHNIKSRKSNKKNPIGEEANKRKNN